MGIDACIHDGWLMFSNYRGVIKEYLYYLLLFEKERILLSANGSVFKNLKTDILKNHIVKIPNISEQKAIADILSSLDEKIELNNQMNETLEEMAQALFKRWFVDFEFPNEEGNPYKSSGGEMVESELGMIPKGWEIQDIDSMTELIIDYRGKTPKKLGHDWSESGILAISAKNIKNNKLVNLENAKYVDEVLYEKWMKDKVKLGDILMTSEAPLGELFYVADDTRYCLSQRIYCLRSNSTIMKSSIFYYVLGSNQVKNEILNRATGTTVTGIRQSELRRVRILVPPMSLQNKLDSILMQNLYKKCTLEEENSYLKQLREILLPKLMSGEIRVSDLC